jgi:hypothetical protein
MARALGGITDQVIAETPISVLDFETTGLSPGPDRVLEVSVVRMEPGRSPRLVFDTLVDPGRRVAATSIHGITDEDVIGAPAFDEIAGDLVRALSDSVVAAYNVYFDLRFLEFELAGSGLACSPPHFCLMWMRPMLARPGYGATSSCAASAGIRLPRRVPTTWSPARASSRGENRGSYRFRASPSAQAVTQRRNR